MIYIINIQIHVINIYNISQLTNCEKSNFQCLQRHFKLLYTLMEGRFSLLLSTLVRYIWFVLIQIFMRVTHMNQGKAGTYIICSITKRKAKSALEACYMLDQISKRPKQWV